FVFGNQGLDRVSIVWSQQGKQVFQDRASGLLAPGAVKLADLNGDGVQDLLVANSGANNVMVYLGLVGGGFGPALNDGKGFFTGTNPTGLTVGDLNGDGRLDVIVANSGSNDVSILLSQGSGAAWTLTAGSRLQAGMGPTSTALADATGDG